MHARGKIFFSWNIIVLFLIIFCSIAKAQEPAYENYTASDGLPSNNIYAVTQDKDGFLWFATDNGVSRFDGKRFRNFSIADGLTDNTILGLSQDSKGRIWFLTFNGKLSYYLNGTIHNPDNDTLLRKIKLKNSILYFFEDSKHNIWISCIDRSLVRISPDYKVKIYYKMLNNHDMECKAILENRNKTYCVSSRGVSPLVNDRFFYTDIGITMRVAIPLHDDTLLAGTTQGLALYDLKQKKVALISTEQKYRSPNVQGLYKDKHNNIWVSHINGVTEFDNSAVSPEHVHEFFNGYSVTGTLNDKDDNLWFCTMGSGIFVISSLYINQFDKRDGLVENNVTSLAYIKNNTLLIGTQNGSVQLINDNKIKNYNQSLIVPHGNIVKIANDLKGNTWILTTVSFLKYHNGIFTNTVSYRWNKGLYISDDGTIWLGMGRGFGKFVNDKIDSLYEDSVANRFYAFEDIGTNTLAMGSDKGLYYYKNGKLEYKGFDDTLLSHRINSLAYTKDSTLWIATNGYGLLSIYNGKIKKYTIKDHLLSNHCNYLLVDKNKVYLCTGKGLNIIEGSHNNTKIISYTGINGLANNNINQIVRKNDKEFTVATDVGVITFEEGKLPLRSAPKPFIDEVYINDNKQKIENLSNLPYTDNAIRIDFGVINFNSTSNTLYRYKLTGADSGWSYTNTPSVKYSHLQPGKYVFALSAEDGVGNRSGKEISFSFYIQTPWWQTWWFRGIVIMIVAGIIISIVRARVNVYKRKLEQQRSMAESELKALRSQINPHFIYNSLNSIQDFIMQNQKEDANLYLAKFAKLMRNILAHSRTSKISLVEEIESLHIYLELESLRFNNQFTFQIEVDNKMNPEEVDIPSMILQPYVENAVLHGLAPKEQGGNIVINFSRKEKLLVCTIEDNGIGRKKAMELKQQKVWKGMKSLGMSITQERIELLSIGEKNKINLEINDLADEQNRPLGTRVTLYFPLP